MTLPVEWKLPGGPISREQLVAEWEDLHHRNLTEGPGGQFLFDVHYWCADGPVRSQSAVDCNGCAKMPQAQRADLRFCRQPSQLDLTNAQYDVVENRWVTGHYNLP
jgi:hypothetical protein